jgi:hypothetical protein
MALVPQSRNPYEVEDEPQAPECADCGTPATGHVYADAHGSNPIPLCTGCLQAYEDLDAEIAGLMYRVNEIPIEAQRRR